ncbi:hypothetical protein SADUNF_Sadunf11G0057100 [Salix dunnii]|uniref:Uncharacterized protein n=1 Tax=Salix dunnii TaxID=1413687 RepID=A0A835JMR0_9ROSI|nr:hypothetical protein SADUNF_Sadunf11G0057100 [Salix dunnii]
MLLYLAIGSPSSLLRFILQLYRPIRSDDHTTSLSQLSYARVLTKKFMRVSSLANSPEVVVEKNPTFSGDPCPTSNKSPPRDREVVAKRKKTNLPLWDAKPLSGIGKVGLWLYCFCSGCWIGLVVGACSPEHAYLWMPIRYDSLVFN